MAPRGVSLAVPLLLAPLALEPHLCVAQTILGLIGSGAKQPPIGFMLAAHAKWLQRQAALFCCVSSCSRLLLHPSKSASSNVQRQQLAWYVASLPPRKQIAPRSRAAPNVRQGVNGYRTIGALSWAHAAALAVPPSHHTAQEGCLNYNHPKATSGLGTSNSVRLTSTSMHTTITMQSGADVEIAACICSW